MKGQRGQAEEVVDVEPGAAAAVVEAQGEALLAKFGQGEEGAADECQQVEDGDDAHAVFASDGGDTGAAVQFVEDVSGGGSRAGVAVQGAVGVKVSPGFAVAGFPVQRRGSVFVGVQVEEEAGGVFGVLCHVAHEARELCHVGGGADFCRGRACPTGDVVVEDGQAAADEADGEEDGAGDADPAVQGELVF